MKMNVLVTLLVPTVLMLVSASRAAASTNANTQNSSTTTVAQPAPAVSPVYHADFRLTRSTNLIDFQDGSRNDSLDYEISPSMKTTYGTLLTSITYSQNLRDKYSRTASDWGDIPFIFSFNPTKWKWNSRDAKISYSLTAVLPVSQYSTKRDQLQTIISSSIGFSLSPSDGEGFGFSSSISLGRYIHAFEEDINGNVLNQYSSNQSVGINYSVSDWSLSATFANRSRWTYRNNTKSVFDMTEELGYSVNNNISLAVGHTNAGSTLKPNGTDSNLDVYNENNSTVYATLGLSY